MSRYTRGLIPAHAGKTVKVSVIAETKKAHPRSRGENPAARKAWPSTPGSSPLTRGKRHRHICGRLPSRLIPAHAGKTRMRTSSTCLDRAHPRSRGENLGNDDARRRESGSSPLTRGKRDARFLQYLDHGLIPAHAGKTGRLPLGGWRRGAHPRSRGENLPDEMATCQAGGSSPLTRGKRSTRLWMPTRSGLIPAHAGKTPPPIGATKSQRAHPRSRGENRAPVAKWRDRGGSSPLTRGKREPPCDTLPSRRLIPAHAGKTGDVPSHCEVRRAHPRSRGENIQG